MSWGKTKSIEFWKRKESINMEQMENNDFMYALTFAYEIELSPCLAKLCE